jgi:hypothetical protein
MEKGGMKIFPTGKSLSTEHLWENRFFVTVRQK